MTYTVDENTVVVISAKRLLELEKQAEELANLRAVVEAAEKVKAELDVIRNHLDRAPLHVHVDTHNALAAALERVKAEEK